MRNLKENHPLGNANHDVDNADKKQQSEHASSFNSAAWKMHFSLGENVRFTRTPEVELVQRRGETLPEINSGKTISTSQFDASKAAQTQPRAVAEMQNSVSENLMRSPAAPVPPAMPATPSNASSAWEDTPSVAAAPLAKSQSPISSTPVQTPSTSSSDTISAFQYLSDFAFYEGMNLIPSGDQPEAPAKPARPAPTVESIIAQFRTVEWNNSAPQKPENIQESPREIKEESVENPVKLEQVTDSSSEVNSNTSTPEISGEVVLPIEEAPQINKAEDQSIEAPVKTTAMEAAPLATPAPEPQAVKVAPPVALYQPQPLPPTQNVVIHGDYQFPPRDLLQEPPSPEGNVITQEMLERSAGLLESVLEDFGVRGEIIHVRPGPVVTLYEFEPAPGVKSSRVIGLADDIARSMSALSARVAVVPGRNVIGIELPNANRETVYLRELVDSRAFESSNYRLPLCLGKGIGGEAVIAELAKMPHLLVAGTTGSGKSVAINTMILSLLYRFKPEECRLIMVDPKMLELSIYDGIPHLLTPVVTDPKKAVVALKWAVREMEDRYRKMARLGVRNIEGFNQRAASAKGKGETVMCTVQSGFDKETGEPVYIQEELDLTPMPYIVVIIDEMADLMMVAGKDIEGAVQRLAQMARAAGIHLIMATQRPSVDVITGTIKANFPTRISFQVTSKIDSRTILGEMGAEQLLGQGDMLHMAGGGRILRVHGPFVSDEEVEKVVDHLKEQGRPDYLATVTEDEEEEEPEVAVFDNTATGSEDGDDLYEQAVKVVMRDKKCSTSYIQRRLGIGYNRAASLVERMEQAGLVGAANHVGKREILAGNRD